MISLAIMAGIESEFSRSDRHPETARHRLIRRGARPRQIRSSPPRLHAAAAPGDRSRGEFEAFDRGQPERLESARTGRTSSGVPKTKFRPKAAESPNCKSGDIPFHTASFRITGADKGDFCGPDLRWRHVGPPRWARLFGRLPASTAAGFDDTETGR